MIIQINVRTGNVDIAPAELLEMLTNHIQNMSPADKIDSCSAVSNNDFTFEIRRDHFVDGSSLIIPHLERK